MTEAPQGQGQPAPEAGQDQAPQGQQREPQYKYTDKDVDKYKGDARKEARSALLKDLGFENPDDLKTFVSNYRDVEEATKSEADKLSEQLKGLKPKAERADSLEGVLKGYLEKERTGIPEHIGTLLDRMSVEDQLAWISENRESFEAAPQPPSIGRSVAPGVPSVPRSGDEYQDLMARQLGRIFGRR